MAILGQFQSSEGYFLTFHKFLCFIFSHPSSLFSEEDKVPSILTLIENDHAT